MLMIIRLEEVVDPWIGKLWDALPSTVEYDESKYQAYVAGGSKSKLRINKNGESNGTTEEKKLDSHHVTAVAKQVEQLRVNATDPVDLTAAHAQTQSEDHSSLANGLTADTPSADQAQRYDVATTVVIDKAVVEAATELKGVPKLPAEFLLASPGTETRSTEESRAHQLDLYKQAGGTAAYDYTASSPFASRITAVRCLTGSRALKRVIEITLDLSGLGWEYVPGDAFGINCPNTDKLVLAILEKLGLDPAQSFKMEPKEVGGSSGE